MFRLHSLSCFLLPISTWSSMRWTHEADWGARSNLQCVDYSCFYYLPHKTVHARKTHTFIHQLCLESVIVPLLKEELETWHRSSREEREQGETQREIQTWFGNQTSRRQISTQPPAHSCYHITSQWLCLCFTCWNHCPHDPNASLSTQAHREQLVTARQSSIEAACSPVWIQESHVPCLVEDFCKALPQWVVRADSIVCLKEMRSKNGAWEQGYSLTSLTQATLDSQEPREMEV